METPPRPLPPGPSPTDPAVYRFWIDEHVRFADLDPLGHANNAAISAYFESARVALFHAIDAPLGSDGRSVVLARLTVDFRRELRYPSSVRVGTRVLRHGHSSVSLGAGIFVADTCVATSEAVCVLFDLASRRAVEIPADLRQRLAVYGDQPTATAGRS